jgi:hypothetical protein
MQMKTTELLANRLEEVLLNGTWIANTNYKHALQDVNLETATQQLGTINTIAILAQHIHYYINGLNEAFNTQELTIRDAYSFDFPAMESEAQWQSFLERFWADAKKFIEHVRQLEDALLQAPFIDARYGSYMRNIDAMIEHSYYHLGQIVLLKKLV